MTALAKAVADVKEALQLKGYLVPEPRLVIANRVAELEARDLVEGGLVFTVQVKV